MYCSKKCTDAAYRARKKASTVVTETSTTDPDEVIEKFTKRFGFPVRLFWNKRLERENSSCAKAGTTLEFEQISKKGGRVIYRVREVKETSLHQTRSYWTHKNHQGFRKAQ
jgi:hypothetical protein